MREITPIAERRSLLNQNKFGSCPMRPELRTTNAPKNADANGLTVGIRSHCARGKYPLVKPNQALDNVGPLDRRGTCL